MSPCCSVCLNAAEKVYHCSLCKDSEYILCSKACQKADWKRHKSVCVSFTTIHATIKEDVVCDFVVPTEDKAAHDLLKDASPESIARAKCGYQWYVQGKGSDNDKVMPWADWLKMEEAIAVDKILYYHGFVHWINGDRRVNGMLNIQFLHVCDALVLNLAESKSQLKVECNMMDGLKPEQQIFIHENVDHFWMAYGYHSNHSKLPINIAPPTCMVRSSQIYRQAAFRKEQVEKRNKQITGGNTVDDYTFWLMHTKGLLRKKN